MPALIKRGNSPYWYARFQLNGKDHWISTKCANKEAAQKKLKEIVAEKRGGLTCEHYLRRLLDLLADLPPAQQAAKRTELVRHILHAQEQKVAIAQGWERWTNHSNREYDPKEKTLKGYEAIWKRFKAWAEPQGLVFLHEVGRGHAEKYASNLWESKVSPSTYNQHIKFLRSLFAALEAQAGIVANPWSHLKSKKKSHDEGRRNLTLEELQTILAKATGNMKLMLAVGLFTGLRLADVVNLRWADINFATGFLTCIPVKTSRFRKRVDIPLHAEVLRLLQGHKAKAKGEYLFPAERAAHEENPALVTDPIQEFFQNCGIQTTEKAEHGHRRRAIVRVGFHSLRHSFVSLCAKAGAPMHVVQKLVGHGNPMLTADVYTHLDAEQKKEAVAALPSMFAKAASTK